MQRGASHSEGQVMYMDPCESSRGSTANLMSYNTDKLILS